MVASGQAQAPWLTLSSPFPGMNLEALRSSTESGTRPPPGRPLTRNRAAPPASGPPACGRDRPAGPPAHIDCRQRCQPV